MLPGLLNNLKWQFWSWGLFLTLLCAADTLQGQAPILRRYTVDEGLPSSHVYMSMQDRLGYIWIATDRGISKFDGYRFKNFTKQDGLPSNDAWHLAQDANDRIWLGTFNGLVFIEGDTVRRLPDPSFPVAGNMLDHHISGDNHIVKVAEPSYRTLTIDNELNVKEWERFNLSTFSPGRWLVIEDESSTPFFNHFRKARKIDDSKRPLINIEGFIYYDPEHELRDLFARMYRTDIIREMVIDENKISIFTRDTIYTFIENKLEIVAVDKALNRPVEIISVLSVSGSDRLIFKTDQGCLMYDQELNEIPNFEFLSDLNINTASIDRDGNLWISTNDGLYFLSTNSQYSKTYIPPANSSVEIGAVKADKMGRIWLGGTNNALYEFTNDVIDGFELPGDQSNIIQKMTADHTGGIIVGSDPGLYLSNKTLSNPNRSKSLISNPDNLFEIAGGHAINIKAMATREEYVWISHGRILSKHILSDGQMRFMDRFGINASYALAIDSLNNLWIGQAGGIYRYTGGEDPVPVEGHDIFKAAINDLKFDAQNYLWIATDGNGLFRYKKIR